MSDEDVIGSMDRRKPLTAWERVKAHFDQHVASLLVLAAVFGVFRAVSNEQANTRRDASEALSIARTANARSEETMRRVDAVVYDMGAIREKLSSVYWLMEKMWERQTGLPAPTPPSATPRPVP